MTTITELMPQSVWTYFAKICSIPHTSGNEALISKELTLIAQELNLSYEVKPCGNVIIYKNATENYNSKPTVILQAHMDMVGVKKNGLDFDFLKDPITPIIDEQGYVHANGTTLGADDGIGVAMILAILADSKLEHPAIKAIFTVGEETHMVGANKLCPEDLTGKYVINIDSESLGEICIGCAGGTSFDIELIPEIMEIPADYSALEIHVSRGTGGHSGIDIDKNRVNAGLAILTLIRSLANEEIKAGISLLSTGTVRNSIPGDGIAIITVPSSCVTKAKHTLTDISERIRTKYQQSDPNLNITVENISLPNIMISTQSTKNLIRLSELNTRVIERTPQGEPLTSCNVGVMKFEDGKVKLELLARYATSQGQQLITEKIASITSLANASITNTESYTYWEPDFNSKLAELASTEFEKLLAKKSQQTVIHAGLECGLFKALNPQLDIISIGPDVLGAHSVKESVNIDSVKQCHAWLIAILKAI